MKRFITAIALLAGTAFGYGQECSTQTEPNYNGDESGCRQGISLYTEFLKQENFKDASKNQLMIGDNSPANNQGASLFASQVPTDILNVNRTTSPDLGAYQHMLFVEE